MTRAPSSPATTPAPALLLSLSSSAYHASIVADSDAFYVLTGAAAYRLVPGAAPVRMPLDLGFGAAAARSSLLFWSQGAIFEAPKLGGKPRRLAALPIRPQSFVTSGDEFAWLERSDDDRFTFRSLVRGRPATAYASPGKIDAATMLSDWIFFVERSPDSSWRIGGVKAAGGVPTFTASRRGRSPAMLVGRGDLYYYDGNAFEVRRLSPDFQREETLARDFICSPLAVWERVYCARVEGLFEIAEGARPRRLAAADPRGPVTDVAANARHVAWIGDSGADKLEVRALALSPHP